MAEDGNYKATPATQEPADCRSAAGAHTNLKQGKVLLVKRMGIQLPAAPVSSVSKQTYDALFARNLMPSHVVALDKLFPVTNYRAGRRSLF
jgi:hypothetical protein